MKQFLESAKSFIIPKKLYGENPYIMIGFYNEHGTEGEFKIEWNSIGIQLKAYEDSWEALSKMPELIKLLAKIDREKLEYSVQDFADELVKLGYKNISKDYL